MLKKPSMISMWASHCRTYPQTCMNTHTDCAQEGIVKSSSGGKVEILLLPTKLLSFEFENHCEVKMVNRYKLIHTNMAEL